MELNEAFINKPGINMPDMVKKIAKELSIETWRAQAVVSLLREGNTIPFISRYRKEATGTLDEVQVRDISHRLSYLENLEERRIEVIRGIFIQGLLTEELYNNIQKCDILSELEELYAPYKKKKRTRAMIALEKGLGELADLMASIGEIEREAARFIDAGKGVENEGEALQGAMDILAERFSQDIDNRKALLEFIMSDGEIIIKGKKVKDASVFKMYYDYRERVSEIKPHRILAINRGIREGELEADIEFDREKALDIMVSRTAIANSYHNASVTDSLKRLMIPSVLREVRGSQSVEADGHGISIFALNLKSLLMQPPIRRTRVLGVDPGIRTGTKAAALDENGKFLGYFLFFQDKEDASIKAIKDAVEKYNIQLIAIGNGTGSNEVRQVVSKAITVFKLPVEYTVVSEDGASVYSASDIAIEEFPGLDLTIRGAISIGRRLQDPLAEFVKIDPKSIGVGLYPA